MKKLIVALLFGWAGIFAPAHSVADEQLKELKAPRVLTLPEVPTGYYRQSRMAIWDYYAVDRQGYFRPRVILAPEGSYFLYNGAPYPMAPVKPQSVIPHIIE